MPEEIRRLRYYEKVVVISSKRFPESAGRTGVVLGISQDDDRVYGYSVFLDGETEGLSFLPEELKGTGDLADRAEFYDENDVVRVIVKDGSGSLAD